MIFTCLLTYGVVKQLVAFLTVGESWYVRSPSSRCCESNLVISPEFQGRGIGRELVRMELSLAAELGYTTMINDYSASNGRMRALLRRLHGRDQITIGCLPRGLYTAGVGWDDQIILFMNIHDSRRFTEIAERSRTRAIRSAKL